MKRRFTVALAGLGIVAASGLCAAQGTLIPPKYAPDATLASTPANAYSLASLAVDFHVGEAVDFVQMVYGAIPKKIFKKNPEYWLKR